MCTNLKQIKVNESEEYYNNRRLTIFWECQWIVMCDESVDLECIDHWRQHRCCGGHKSDVVPAISGPIPNTIAQGICSQVRRAVLVQPVLIKGNVELPQLSVLKVGKVQEHHEFTESTAVLPCDVELCVVASCFNGGLDNGQGYNNARIWFNG